MDKELKDFQHVKDYFDKIGVAVALRTIPGEIVDYNSNFLLFHGINESESVKGHHVTEYVDQEALDEVNEALFRDKVENFVQVLKELFPTSKIITRCTSFIDNYSNSSYIVVFMTKEIEVDIPFEEHLVYLKERIKEVRANSGLTQDKFSKSVNISLRNFQRIEAGETTPTVELLLKIASSYKLSMSYFLKKP